MIFKSLETLANGDPWLEGIAVGDFETPTALFIDIFHYRETLPAGTYTLEGEGRTYTFDLPQEEAQVTELGFPGILWNVTLQTTERG